MKIYSRPEGQVYGEGAYSIAVDIEELELIAAFLYVTRLGKGTYKAAAYKLMTTVESIFDDGFLELSSDSIDLHVSQIDARDTIIEQFDNSEIIFEV